MLPRSFIINKEERPDFICNICNFSISWDVAEQIIEKIGIDLSQIKKGDIQACKIFLERHSKTLHENHFYMIDVKLALSQLIGQEKMLTNTEIELISEKILLCKKLNELFGILVPGKNIFNLRKIR